MDLNALATKLSQEGSAITLAAGDPTLPPEVVAFLQGAPSQTITIAPGPGGVSLSGQVLSVSGTTTGAWPVQGLFSVSVSVTSVALTIDASKSPPVFGLTSNGALAVGSSSLPVTVHTVSGTPGLFRVDLQTATSGPSALDLLLLGAPSGMPFDLPSGLGILSTKVTVDPASFFVQFVPAIQRSAYYTFTLPIPGATWSPISGGVLGFTSVDLVAVVTSGSVSGAVVGHMSIAGTAVDVRIGITSGTGWVASVAPSAGGTVPGLAALASWVGGSSLSSSVTGGFGSLSFDTSAFDLALKQVSVGFDWSAAALSYVDVGSVLTVGGIPLDVSLRLPDVTLTGSLHGSPVALSGVISAFGLPADGVPSTLQITAVTFDAQPGDARYAAGMTLDNVWQVGPVSIEQLGFTVQYEGGTGFTGHFDGIIGIGSTATIDIGADYLGAGAGWQFEGGTGVGTSLAIGDVIADLASKFGVSQVPAALSRLVLTDLSFTYATATQSFSFVCDGATTVCNVPVTLSTNVAIAPASGGASGYTAAFHGSLTFIGLTFAVDLQPGGDTVLTLALPDMKLGDALSRLVALVDPNFELQVDAPWSAILDFDLSNKAIVFDVTTGSVSLTATTGSLATVDLLGLATATLTSITYAKGQSIKVTGSFDVTGVGSLPIDWDAVNQPPPTVPSPTPAAFKLNYLGLGQHVSLTNTGDLTTVSSVITALEKVPVAQDPTTSLHDLAFDASSGWLIGFDINIKGAIAVQVIFNDPAIYGLKIGLSGSLVGALDGLSFEILYRKIADGLGLYHIDLLVPLVMRHLEFGEVSITLPHIILDIYTNGSFLVDFGFPYNRDFSQSMMIEVFPFTGAGGFYFGVLDVPGSSLVPANNGLGIFQPIITFGFGLQVGVGKTFSAGPLSAGVLVAVEGILEGVIAFWKGNDGSSETYLKLSGTVAINVHVWGSVDFVIVSASIDIYVFAAVQLQIESHKPIYLQISAGVSVEASARVCGLFTIHFSFSCTVSESFTIGSGSQAPWDLPQLSH